MRGHNASDDGRDQELVVFLHGLGVGPSSWEHQMSNLPAGYHGVAVPILESGRPFSLERAVGEVVETLDAHGVAKAHVCGLSLGALIATKLAIDRPTRCASMVISGGQVRPNPVLMWIQRLVLAGLPTRLVRVEDVGKAELLEILTITAHTDLRTELQKITVPTLVLCGARDWANRHSARELAAGIPGSSLRVIRGGHQLNTQNPAEFTKYLNRFINGLGPSSGT